MRLTPIQKAYNAARTPRDIILKPRQVYMTTLEAARDLWWFLTKPGARVVIVCQSQTEQGSLKDISEKFRIFFDSLERLGVKLEFGRDSTTEWSIPKRDSTMRIIQAGASDASASKKGRGGTLNRIHYTEVALYEQARETFNSLNGSLAKVGAESVMESTPRGASGFFYEQWRSAVQGDSAYRPHFFPWWMHPEYRTPLAKAETFEPLTQLERTLDTQGVPVECLKWYREQVADNGNNFELVAQEYPSDPDTCFLLAGRSFFDQKRTTDLLLAAREPMFSQVVRESGAYGQIVNGREIPGIRVWSPPERGRSYVIGVDVSEGTGGDAGAGIVLERGTGRHMATIWGQFRPWELARVVAAMGRKYNNAVAAVERNNHGHACLRALETEHKYRDFVFVDRDEEHGWRNSETTRAPTLDTFEQAFRMNGGFTTEDRFLLSEMRTFTVNDRGRAEAAKGAHDDLVMAAAIAWDVLCRPLQRQSGSADLPVA